MGGRKEKITTFVFQTKADEAQYEQVPLHGKSPHLGRFRGVFRPLGQQQLDNRPIWLSHSIFALSSFW